jgi:hypothetical protein
MAPEEKFPWWVHANIRIVSGGILASFTVIQTDAGTNPVATGDTDTLTLTSTEVTITGNQATDTVTFEVKNSAVLAKVLTGFSASAGTVADTDTILEAINKIVGNVALKAPLASPAFTGAVTFGNYHMEPSEVDDGNSSTADTIDWSAGSAHKSTLTGNVTYTFSNPVTGGSYVLRVLSGAGGFTVTWPATVKWYGGVTPTVTSTASRMDLFNFYWDGTNYYGSYTQNYTP